MNILVSACLLGNACRYDGKSKPNEKVIALAKKHNLIPCCPETDGGLSIPRPPAEQKDGQVVNKEGLDVTEFFERGAEIALKKAFENDCTLAVLKARSPSCGVGKIYDGTFSGTLTDGDGITAKLLKANGITVITEEDIDHLI